MTVNKKIISVLILTFGLGGCVSATLNIPNYTNELKVHTSKNHVSGFTEIPSEDKLIKNSQVYMAGKGTMGGNWGLIGAAIDQSMNSREFKGENETLSVNFDQLLSGMLSTQMKELDSLSIRVIQLESLADIVLIPSVRLEVDDNDIASATFRIAVRFIEPISKNKGTRDYYYYVRDNHKVVGEDSWAENNANKLKTNAKVAFSKLLNVISNDIKGDYKLFNESQSKKFINYETSNKYIWKLAMLEEYDDYVVSSSQHKDVANYRVFVILPKEFIEEVH